MHQNWQANEDNKAIVDDKSHEILGANKANVIFEAAEADKVNAEADKVNKSNKINVASVMINQIIVINEAVLADKVIWASKAFEAIKLPRLPLLLTFSLTKYSAIFVDVKVYFGINDNQLGGVKLVEIWSKTCSLQIWNWNNTIDNQLGYSNSECFSLRN